MAGGQSERRQGPESQRHALRDDQSLGLGAVALVAVEAEYLDPPGGG
jgi:hypothetical protein